MSAVVRPTVARRAAASAAALVFLLAARQARGQSFEGIKLVPEHPTTHDRIEITVASAHGSAWYFLDTLDGGIVITAGDEQIIGVPPLDGPSKTFSIGYRPPGIYRIEFILSVGNYFQEYEHTFTVVPPDPTLELHGGRFKVRVDWTNPYDPGQGQGFARPLTDESGAFWFFGPDNVEVTIKVLDGRVVNGHFWVFIANMSTVEFTVTSKTVPPTGCPSPARRAATATRPSPTRTSSTPAPSPSRSPSPAPAPRAER